MKTQSGTFENLGLHASKALGRLTQWLAGDGVLDLIGALGLALPDTPSTAALKLAAADVAEAATNLQIPTQELIAALEATPADAATAAGAAADLFLAIEDVLAAIQPVRLAIENFDGVPPGVLANFANQLLKRLIDFVAITHVELEWPFLFRVLVALGIVELEKLEADPTTFRSSHVRRSLNLERLKLLLDPTLNPAETIYRWGHDDLRADALLDIVSRIAISVGVPAYYSKPDNEVGRIDFGPIQLIHRPDLNPGGFAAQLSEAAFNPQPFQVALSPSLVAELQVETDISQPPAILIEPGSAPRLQNPGAMSDGRITLGVTASSQSEEKSLLLGQPQGTRFEADSLQWTAELRIEPTDQGVLLTPFLLAQVEGGSITIDLGEADGFLAGLLSEGPRIDFDFGLGWDRERGLHLAEGVGLSVVIPIGKELGPILLDALHVEAAAVDTGLQLDLSATLSGTLGPISFSVDRVGTRVGFLTSGDDAKPLRIEFGFRPPTGVALTVDAGAVGGGGFLQFDANRAEYSGAMQLEAAGVRFSAIGVLTTRLPDSADGFSLLVILSAEFSPGIQLGYGFVLTKVGGLLGVHRAVQLEAFRAGLQTGALGSILFPEDPVRNSSQILRDLAGVFPPTSGRHVFGPVVEISWGLPRPILKMGLALLLELPAPIRVALLGRIQMFLPDEEVALARINMDSLGVLDPHQREISIDATLFDSTLTIYPLTGDMAMRVRYGDNPQFALAIGGFHPAFQPPPGFPSLERVAIAMSAGNNPRIRLEAYLALTSNTLQVGARVEINASAAGFSISGTLGFDGLFQFSPFQFVVEINGRVALKRGSENLMSLTLQLTLSGITPWRARGSVSFQILLFKGSISFDKTFGGGSQPVIPTLDVWPLLKAALESAGSWSAELPSCARSVSLATPVDAPGTVLVHPLATPTVRQKVVPLSIHLDRIGQARPTDGDLFALAPQATVGEGEAGRPVAAEPVLDYFAAAQFQDLSDSDKLSRPSFESMQAGVSVGRDSLTLGTTTSRAVEYEEILIDAKRQRAFPMSHLRTSIGLSKDELRAGAAARADRADQRPGRRSFEADSIRVELKDPEYALTEMTSPTGTGIEPKFKTSYSAIGARGNRVRRPVVERSEIATGTLDMFNHE